MAALGLWYAGCLVAADLGLTDGNALLMPVPGSYQLRILSPTLLELTLINTKAADPERVTQWDLVDRNFQFQPPALNEFAVTVGGRAAAAQSVGFKRRPLYAPLARRDLRIANHLYLRMNTPIADNQVVEVKNPGARLWVTNWHFIATADPLRYSPAIHVNQAGYVPRFPKKAMIGYYLGSMGELEAWPQLGFKLVEAQSGAPVYQGSLVPRPDVGYPYSPTPYQEVLEADFSDVTVPGEYKLVVPGLGASDPFRVDEGVAICFARTYALGLYHQRCGTNNALPFTRHTHTACHIAPADIPSPQTNFEFTWTTIAQKTADYANNVRHVAPRLKDEASQLYPFVNQGKIDLSGGHHDAGDYSKYTINSAGLIHALVFGADVFPGVGDLDNLGIPESGDGKSDLLQEAKWEADFLVKMQDADGGFYFLVYPRNREYESYVLPDQGDPQVVWPKTTAVTAAAVAVLAQCASSPRFKQQFPDVASNYLASAQRGWSFLTNAIARYGNDGAYQKITHYGDEFMHDDELAWAACEMFLATGEESYHEKLRAWFDPGSPATWRWSFWHMYEAYGHAVRSYVFAARSGRLSTHQLDAAYLAKCEAQIMAAANDALSSSQQNAYGSSFSIRDKQSGAAGWYFSSDKAFDITVAFQLDPRPEYLDAIVANLNYEAGCNPVSVCYVTGLGWRRQREIVHQYAQNDRRVLPPSGIPIGNIQSGFPSLDNYRNELNALSFPTDNALTGPYPLYDRWADTFNVTTEFVAAILARCLANAAFLAARTTLTNQSWVPLRAQIAGLPALATTNVAVTATLEVPDFDLGGAQIVWEARDQEPALGTDYTVSATNHGNQWVEAEALLPDGRRIFAAGNFYATNGLPTVSVVVDTTNIMEGSLTLARFEFMRVENTNTALTVFYRLSGTATKFIDYRRPEGDMPDLVTIPAGAVSAIIQIRAVDDTLVEGSEMVVLTLTTNANYNIELPNNATATIADNDVAIVGITTSPSGGVRISWTSESGKNYQVESKDNLSDPGWYGLSGSIGAASSTTSWTDFTAGSVPQRFYRISSAP